MSNTPGRTRRRPRKPTEPPVLPAPDPEPPAPPNPPEPTPAYVIGSFGNASIDQHDQHFVDAFWKVREKKGVEVDPRFIKAIMDVESDKNGDYPVDKCRPYDGYPGPLSCGPMQIKWPYHEARCPACDQTTVAGHIELATHIIGDTMQAHGLDEYGAYTTAYLTSDDINGNTQQGVVRRLRQLVATMEADAGQAPTPVPLQEPVNDPIELIVGRSAFDDDYGWRDRAGVNYGNYAPGHGTVHWDEHPGIDVVMPCGTKLYAPVAGVVACVGRQGTPQPGRACGAYGDDGGGPGNITIKLDGTPTTWLTLGHSRSATVRPGERVAAGQLVGTVGTAGGGCHAHVECSVIQGGAYLLLEPRTALRALMGGAPAAPVIETPPLVWIGTNNYQSRGGVEPTFIVYHMTDDLSFANVKSWFQNKSSGASSHFVIDRDGTAYQFVGSAHASWTNGAVRQPRTDLPALTKAIRSGVNFNTYCITFEFIADRDSGFTAEQIETGIAWTRYSLKKYPTIRPDREHLLLHSDIDSVQRAYCPGASFPLDQMLAAVGGG